MARLGSETSMFELEECEQLEKRKSEDSFSNTDTANDEEEENNSIHGVANKPTVDSSENGQQELLVPENYTSYSRRSEHVLPRDQGATALEIEVDTATGSSGLVQREPIRVGTHWVQALGLPFTHYKRYYISFRGSRKHKHGRKLKRNGIDDKNMRELRRKPIRV